MISRNVVQYEFYSRGKSTRQIADEMGCSQRHIQALLEDGFLKIYGRTKQVALFSVAELYYVTQYPKERDIIINRKYKDYYINQCKKNMGYDLNSPNHGMARAKLRALVMIRDKYKCVECGSSIALEVHHKIPIKESPDLEFDVDNCETLCHACHWEIVV